MSTFRDVPCLAIDDPLLATRFSSHDDGLEDLAQSIDQLGLLQPVVVVEHEEGYRLVAGQRRLLACLLLGWETIPAHVLSRTYGMEYCATLTENLRRRNLNPLEEAYALTTTLAETGLSQRSLAQRLGLSEAAVSRRLALTELPKDLQDAVAQENLVASSALEIARIWEPGQQAFYLKLAIRQGATRNTVRDWVQAWLQYNEPSGDAEEVLAPAQVPNPLPRTAPLACVGCGRTLEVVHLDYLPICPECGEALAGRAE